MSRLDHRCIRGLFVLLLLELIISVHTLLAIWPEVTKVATPEAQTADASAGPTATPEFAPINLLGGTWVDPSADGLYLVAVIVIGGIGSLIHALTSLASYAGNRTFRSSWTWWYVVRLPIGASIAVLLYFVVRGGLLSVGTAAGAISPYGIGALAGLSGMFSKQATDKLEEVFSTLFRTVDSGDAERKDKITETLLSVDELAPAAVTVGTADLTVKMIGTGFVDGMTVTVGGKQRPVVVASLTECSVMLDESDVANAGRLEIVVRTEGPRPESSTAVLEVKAPPG